MEKRLLDGTRSVNRLHDKCGQVIRSPAAVIGRQLCRLIHRAHLQSGPGSNLRRIPHQRQDTEWRYTDQAFRTSRPANFACGPSSSSIRSSWLYFAVLSDRASEPVLICPQLVATARSAMVESSVSPDRCDITAV